MSPLILQGEPPLVLGNESSHVSITLRGGPSSGALNAAQADELTRIVAQHCLPATGAGGSASFDWDCIIGAAHTILADRQMEDFIAAVSHRRASDQMSAIAAQAKR